MALAAQPAKKPMGVVSKLTLSLFVLSLVPIFSTMYATLSTSQPQMEKLATDNVKGLVQSYRGSIEQWEEQNHALGRLAAKEMERFAPEDEKSQKESLVSLVKASGGSIITAWNTDGDGQQTVRDNDGKLSNIFERGYYKEAKEHGLGRIDVAFSKSTGKYTTLAGYRYRPPAINAGFYVLGINWNPEFFKTAADRLTLGKTGRAAIVSADGLFVHTTDSKTGETAEKGLLAKLPTNGETSLFEHTDDKGGRWLIAASSDDRRGLRYVVMQAHDEAFGPVETQKTYAMWGGAVALVFTLVFVGFIRQTFAKPIVEVAAALRAVADKQPSELWKVEVPHTGKHDEIGSIARAAQRIQKLIYTGYAAKAGGKGGQ